MTNHVDRFYAAVSVLAGDGHIKQRLTDAYTGYIAGLHGSDLPAAVQDGFSDLRRRMHSVAPLNGEGPIRASVRKMSGQDAAECSLAILALYTELLRQGTKNRRGAHREEVADPVPPFLVKSASA